MPMTLCPVLLEATVITLETGTLMTAGALVVGSLALYFAVDYGIKMFNDYSRDFSYADCVSKQAQGQRSTQEQSDTKRMSSPTPDIENINNPNPFETPTLEDIIVVDPKGNAIQIPEGHKLTGSEDGKWLQVRDADGFPTGERKDGPHSPHSHTDPRALSPHAHVPGITNEDGTPWLLIHQ